MKIAVCGSNNASDKEIVKKAFEIGKEIATNNILLLTGAGDGYPYEAAKGAFSANGKVLIHAFSVSGPVRGNKITASTPLTARANFSPNSGMSVAAFWWS